MLRLNIFLILTLPFFFSCGAIFDDDVVPTHTRIFSSSNPYFNPLKQEFEEFYYIYTGNSINTSDVFINFADNSLFSDNSIGTCYYIRGVNWGREIVVKASYWSTASESCQRYLIFHELGHCALDQHHRDSHKSIMNTNNSYCHEFVAQENLYLEELFTQSQDSIDLLQR